MLAEFRMVTVRNPTHDCMVIRWAVIPNGHRSDRLAFEIFRSSSPTGPWDLIGEAETGAFHYTDYDISDASHYSRYYYIVRMADVDGNGYRDSKAVRLSHDPDAVALGMVRKKNVFLRAKSGVPAAVLLKKNWGAKCSRCYDEVRKVATDANCRECYGTGFVGGYLTPVFVPCLAAREGMSHSQNMTPGSTVFEISNEPILTPGDVIVDQVLNHRYRVEAVDLRTHRLYVVCQIVTVCRIDENDVVYNLQIPETLESQRGQSHDMTRD